MDGYLGAISIFAGNYAPYGWTFCNGQSLSVQNYQALFALIGYTFGGSGAQFNLPDLRGRAPVGAGSTTTTPSYNAGQQAGVDTITLSIDNIPPHSHNGFIDLSLGCDTSSPGMPDPVGHYPTAYMGAYSQQASANMPVPDITNLSISSTGEGKPVTPRSPYLAVNFIVCLQGIYPDRP
jgi:microcystin-dependent protein